MIREAIILAGGLGTRLRSVVSAQPKCMAVVAGKPFLHYVINYLQQQGIERFIFSLGYKHEMIETYVSDQYSMLDVQYSIEEEPLGTGGAIKLACKKTTRNNVLVLNGDTLFSIDLAKLSTFHELKKASCTLSLKAMADFDRYGAVTLREDNRIDSFKEKQFYKSGLINGGIYALDKAQFTVTNLPDKFSFEKEYLEKFYAEQNMYGIEQDAYFIDIGIPEDYERAQKELC